MLVIIEKTLSINLKFVTENQRRKNLDDRVKEKLHLRNGNLIVKLKDDADVDDHDIA